MHERGYFLTLSCAFLSHLNSWHRAFTAANWLFCTAIINGVAPLYTLYIQCVHAWQMNAHYMDQRAYSAIIAICPVGSRITNHTVLPLSA